MLGSNTTMKQLSPRDWMWDEPGSSRKAAGNLDSLGLADLEPLLPWATSVTGPNLL